MTEEQCANCGSPMTGAWCAACGQRRMPTDPSWSEVLHEAADELLHVNGRIPATLRLLLTQPGALTAELMRGRRVPYVSPLRLYLTTSLVYFVLAAVLPNPDINVASNDRRFDRAVTIAAVDRVLSLVPRMIFALVPVFAWIVRAMYRRVNRNYPTFLFFSLHVHGAFFILMSLTLPLQMFAADILVSVAQLVAFLAMTGYLAAALRRVFGGTPALALRNAVLISGLHVLVFVGALVALWQVFT